MSYYTNIRYGKMRMVGRFKTEREDLRVRDRCIVRTDRGKEWGEVLSPLQPIPETVAPESLWDVIRRAHPEDLVNIERLEKESVPHARKMARELILKLNLPMKLSDVDYVLGGERVIFYFTSDTRVDFRELVRLLAHEFRTRIELKQVGARDQARLVGDAGHCGLELCCRGHLKELGGITMDMAKIQKHTADPSKITGRCGKLLCCLRYEYAAYVEGRDLLPPKGTRISTKKGAGIVADQNLLLREVSIFPDGGGDRILVKYEEIEGNAAAVAGCSGCDAPKAGKAPDTAVANAEAAMATDTKVVSFESGPESSVTPSPPEPPAPSKPMWMSVAKAEEIPQGASLVADLGGPRAALFNVDGVIHAISNECGHQGGPLGEGKLEGFSVACPWHQWKFDVTTGHCLSVAGSSVRKYDCAVVAGEVYVRL